jgi:hypothetical protein
VVGLVDFILYRRGASTGAATGGGALRVAMVASTCGAFVQKGGIRRISKVRERGQGQRGGSGSPVDDEFVRRCLQTCGPPTRNSSVLAASRAEERKGDGGGGHGLLIGVGVGTKRAGNKREFNWGGELLRGGNGHQRGLRTEVEDD